MSQEIEKEGIKDILLPSKGHKKQRNWPLRIALGVVLIFFPVILLKCGGK